MQNDEGVVVDDKMCIDIPGVFMIGNIWNVPFKQMFLVESDKYIPIMTID